MWSRRSRVRVPSLTSPKAELIGPFFRSTREFASQAGTYRDRLQTGRGERAVGDGSGPPDRTGMRHNPWRAPMGSWLDLGLFERPPSWGTFVISGGTPEVSSSLRALIGWPAKRPQKGSSAVPAAPQAEGRKAFERFSAQQRGEIDLDPDFLKQARVRQIRVKQLTPREELSLAMLWPQRTTALAD